MADRGKRGRGRSTQRRPQEQVQPAQSLPHSRAVGSGEAIRRPGESVSIPTLGTGRGVQRVGRGDSAAIALGRGVERLTLQPSVGGGGDAGGDTVATVSSTRGSCRGKRVLPADIFVTKPQHIVDKRGETGSRITLKANYFKLLKTTDWSIQQYHVDFAPEEDRTGVRKGLLRIHKDKLGAYIFDGTLMYTCTRLPETTTLASKRQSDDQHITITVRRVGEMLQGDMSFIQFFNIIMRKCFDYLKLQQVGRDYYDPGNKVVLPEYKLELWPGYITSIRQHERDILMCAGITYKVMRLDTLFDILSMYYNEDKSRFKENFSKAVIGTVVLTHYNNNTYRIEDVDFSTTPSHSFRLNNGEEITYIQYYWKKYEMKISNPKQPMLVTRSKAKARQAKSEEMVYLVPELCRATGLTDSMRDNYKLMAALATHTRLRPNQRIEKLMGFHRRLSGQPEIKKELAEWNLKLDDRLLDVPARLLSSEKIIYGGNVRIQPESVNWSKDMQKKRCLVTVNLTNWVLMISERDSHAVQSFVSTLRKVANGVDMIMDQPTVQTIRDDRPGTYSEALERILSKTVPQMVLCVVSNNRSDRYSAIKKKCCVDRPVPSQVCMFRTLTHRSIMSIATNIAIQMNCKLGGAPWQVEMPLEGLMVVGFDVCHDTTIKGKDFGATVASLNTSMTKYYSIVNSHSEGDELSTDIATNICQAVKQYLALNKRLPSHIIIYRDGVGEGQVPQVKDREVVKIQEGLNAIYPSGPNKYKMAFIIVTKRLNTRLFQNGNNPPAGAVVDDVITSPIKYDFFLVSQQVHQGTITPTSYSVIEDTLALNADKIQRLTYKLTHMYFNCTNTVRVPAPCHYAHKLAFLVSRHIHQAPDSQLQNKLYFL